MDTSPLLCDIRRADALIVETARRLYAERPPEAGEFRGLFVTDQEFFDLLARPFGASLPCEVPIPRYSGPTEDRWTRLQSVFSLEQAEADILLLCLLPEIDLKYERIYGFLQDDVTCKRPTVDLLLNLLWPDLGDRLAARRLFETTSRMVSHEIVHVSPPFEGTDSLLRRTVQIAPDVVRFLLEDPGSAPPVPAPFWLTPVDKCGGAPAAEQPPSALASLIGDADPPLWIHVRSERPWCARALAHELAARAQRPVLEVSTDGLEASGAPNTPQGQIRDALLYNAILLVWLAENADPGGSKERAPAWATLCENDALTVVWYGSPRVSLPLPQDVDIAVHTLNIPVPDYDARLQLWYSAARDLPLSGDADLPALAARYRLDGDQIARAARAAFERARQRYAATPQIGFDDLASASREVSAVRLGDLANQIVPRHTWQDLVLPSDRTAQIREMCDQFRFRHVVYGTWGMGRRSARGQGLSALFAGPSGTGKTMAAEVIAHDLALDLYKIDLSGVVSKYIGETEKNLDRIFDLARDSNAILLFDEADALFGKRSETKDAHDRYANIEISYLLQKVEEYDGVVILTSNLRQNLDEAFMRRLQFSIEFPFPDEAARREIWERTVPPEMPLADDVDWDHLAMRFRLSGGGIRNALVSAAFLAARDGSAVAMRHLLWGVRREFQKLGKLVDEEEFVPAFSGHDLRGAHDGSGGR